MRTVTLSLLTIAMLLMVGCGINPTEPQILEPGQESLSKPVYLAEIASAPPTRTWYKLPEYPDSTIWATGGELLYLNCEAGNTFSSTYAVDLFAEAKAVWDSFESVTIVNPIATQYLGPYGNWVDISTTSTVITRAVQTGKGGSATLQVAVQIGIEEGGNAED